MPQSADGTRMEPPPSVPTASGPSPAATAAPAPPLEPPAVRDGSHGFRVGPNSRLSVTPLCPNSGVFVLPTVMAPATLRRSTQTVSSAGELFENSHAPPVEQT